MTEPLAQLKAILDLLGPGMWLELDRTAFHRAFGGVESSKAAIAIARRFAQEEGCFFFFNHTNQIGRFGRCIFVNPSR